MSKQKDALAAARVTAQTETPQSAHGDVPPTTGEHDLDEDEEGPDEEEFDEAESFAKEVSKPPVVVVSSPRAGEAPVPAYAESLSKSVAAVLNKRVEAPVPAPTPEEQESARKAAEKAALKEEKKVVVVAAPVTNQRLVTYTVENNVRVSFNGQIVKLKAGQVISAAKFGPEGMNRVRSAGAKLRENA